MPKFLFICFFPMLLFCQNVVRDLSLENWEFQQENKDNWLPATIPGTVHTDLFANSVIENPFLGTNEKKIQWIENENWTYKVSFSISKSEIQYQNIDLQFDGLDTYATVFLNGKQILEADNMFRIWKVSVKNQIIEGKNTLEVVFKSAVKEGKLQAQNLTYTLPPDERVFTRKAQYQYGWDWGPRFVTAGIWKDVNLIFWNDIKLVNVKYKQLELTKEKAIVEFNTEINVAKAGKIDLALNDSITTINLEKGLNAIQMQYQIDNPKFWWPNGLGDAYLYPFEISLVGNTSIIETQKINIGLRTIELVQEKDTIGTSFYFKVNGIPVFIKGANYIPDDSFLPSVTDAVYKARIKDAVEANMNMLRVWGGGIYGSDIFYEECDKNGILVWQDFMFACAMYPGDEGYLKNVKQEIIDNVNRLQNHPSLALWCGNNENNEAWHNWGWQKQYKYSTKDSTKIWNDYERLFHQLIPKTLDSLLPKEKNFYWPSSPSIGWGRKESMLQGDSHYWGVWWGKEPFEKYEKKVGRFMSEYGFQGMPNMETFKKFAIKEELNLQSETVKLHQKHPTGYETIEEYMKKDYVIPKSFEDYSYVSQLLQAEGMKIAIESHRRAKPYCMGTLFWQLNDCWPVTSWSSVDYYGNWKAFHYQVKKSFENLLISVAEEDTDYKIYIINDNLENSIGDLIVKTIDFNGKIISEVSLKREVLGNSSQVYYSFPKAAIQKKNHKKTGLSVTFISDKKKVETLYYWVKPKKLALIKPTIKWKYIDPTTIEITSDVLAKNVYLYTNENTHFSANFFDMLPNEVYRITLSKPAQMIKVKSLFDTLY